MLKKDHHLFEGNDKFEGFAMDLLAEIAKQPELSFEYEVYLVPDGKFGSKLPTNEWNGMVGEVLSGNATMSIAPLSINARRESAVDFTKPFKTRGITVLMKTPMSHPSYFQFFKPLSTTVWLCTALSVVTISVILYWLERYSKMHKNATNIDVQESCFFVFGSLVQGGTDVSPTSVSGRILTSAWWLFALLMVSTYTANLAAFLTVKKIQPPISTVTDLAGQTKISFGTVHNSGVETFFKNTRIPAFAEMWSLMDEFFHESMVNTTTEGFNKVKEGNYAFLWDNTVTSYMAATDCGFTEIGPPFDPKGFGIAVPPGARYREDLSLAILRLGDRGIISELENKYWGGTKCDDYTKPATGTTTELKLQNVAGIFFILIGGVCLSLVVCAIGRIIYCNQGRNQTKGKSQHNKSETLYAFPHVGITAFDKNLPRH